MNGVQGCKKYVISRICSTEPENKPFRHMYIEQIFPNEVYDELKGLTVNLRNSDQLLTRHQDSADYDNRRYNFTDDHSPLVKMLRSVFSDQELKIALLSKFYAGRVEEIARKIVIHEREFEITFTTANRFQNIHLDIPPKYLSLVFYLPPEELNKEDQRLNGTVLYDTNMRPYYPAAYKDNSVGIFAQHFYSYHGNSTTVDRTAMVLFYVNKSELESWNTMIRSGLDVAPYDQFKAFTQRKLEKHELIEYAEKSIDPKIERGNCKINAPRGRYLL